MILWDLHAVALANIACVIRSAARLLSFRTLARLFFQSLEMLRISFQSGTLIQYFTKPESLSSPNLNRCLLTSSPNVRCYRVPRLYHLAAEMLKYAAVVSLLSFSLVSRESPECFASKHHDLPSRPSRSQTNKCHLAAFLSHRVFSGQSDNTCLSRERERDK